jgi:5-methylcytosine-specific restriction endonuclease McrA
MRKHTSKWASENPEKIREKWTTQNKKRTVAGKPWTDQDIAIIRKQLGDKCEYCGDELKGGGEVEHMLPLDRGGTNERSNLTLACLKCNRAKGNRTADEFMAWRLARGLVCRKRS